MTDRTETLLRERAEQIASHLKSVGHSCHVHRYHVYGTSEKEGADDYGDRIIAGIEEQIPSGWIVNATIFQGHVEWSVFHDETVGGNHDKLVHNLSGNPKRAL